MELLVTIAILAVLAAIAMAGLHATRHKSNQAKGLSNMRQIAAAFITYTSDHDGRLPLRVLDVTTEGDKWPGLLSKYLKDTRVYADPADPDNYLMTSNPLFKDPLSNTRNCTSYVCNGFNELMHPDEVDVNQTEPQEIYMANIIETSRTILLGNPRNGNYSFYMDIDEANGGNHMTDLDLARYGEGSNYVFVDGSARFMTERDYVADGNENGKRDGDELWLGDKSKLDRL
jgi:prepilin-type processing-associated H-X9-DG protein